MLKYMRKKQDILRQLSVRQIAMGQSAMKPTVGYKINWNDRRDSNPEISRHQVYCTTDVHEVKTMSDQHKSECPLCKDYHTNKKGNYSSCLNLCQTYRNQSVADRLQTVRKTNHCTYCLCKAHPSGKCFMQTSEHTPSHWSLIQDHNNDHQT